MSKRSAKIWFVVCLVVSVIVVVLAIAKIALVGFDAIDIVSVGAVVGNCFSAWMLLDTAKIMNRRP